MQKMSILRPVCQCLSPDFRHHFPPFAIKWNISVNHRQRRSPAESRPSPLNLRSHEPCVPHRSLSTHMTLASTLADAACVHDAMLHARARLLLRAEFAFAAYETACVPLMCARAPIAQTLNRDRADIDHGHRGSRSPSSARSGLRRRRIALS